jgi:THO complex subunit 4
VKLRYDRAGRSEGVAFVTYDVVADARTAIREFDGANAKGQPIRLSLLPPRRRDNPFDKVENPRSLFDRIEAPGGRDRDRRRSESPRSDPGDDRTRSYRRGSGRPAPRDRDRDSDRRSDVTKPAPENIDRYVPGQGGSRGIGGRSSSHRGAGGRRPGERREQRSRRDENNHPLVGGRPRKTAEELDAEMEDYWGGNNNGGNTGANAEDAPAAVVNEEMDMIE